MARRKKSVNDIKEQLSRMDSKLVSSALAARDRGDDAEYNRIQYRRQKVYDTARRYQNNIRNSKSYQGTSGIGNWSVQNEAKASTRKYSQSTYMGLVNG